MMMLERDGSLHMDARTRRHSRHSMLLRHLVRRARNLIRWRLGWTRSGVGG